MKPLFTHATLVLVLLVGGCADLGEPSPDGGADLNADGQTAGDTTATDSGAPDTLVPCRAARRRAPQ